MLLVPGPLYSIQKGTEREICSKGMLSHGAEREICWIDMLLVKCSLYSRQKGTDSKDTLLVGASLLHGADREICW